MGASALKGSTSLPPSIDLRPGPLDDDTKARMGLLAAVERVDQVGRDAPGAIAHLLDQAVARETPQAALVGRDDFPRLRPSPLDRDRHIAELPQMGGRAVDATVGDSLPLNGTV